MPYSGLQYKIYTSFNAVRYYRKIKNTLKVQRYFKIQNL
jgi:hypothetical protein